MSYGTKVKTKGVGIKRGGRWRNHFCNNNQPNNNVDSHTIKLKYLETATYIVIHFSLANWYDKVTKDIIRYVIRKLPDGVNLARGMRDGKLPNMLLDPKSIQEKNTDGKSVVDEDKYDLQVMEWKENLKIHIERKRHINEGNQKPYIILVYQSSLVMCSNL